MGLSQRRDCQTLTETFLNCRIFSISYICFLTCSNAVNNLIMMYGCTASSMMLQLYLSVNIEESLCLLMLLCKVQFTPHRQMPTNTNKLVCRSLLDQCVTPLSVAGICWRWLEFGFTQLNMLNLCFLGHGMSELCEMIFQQMTTSDVM